MNIQSLILMACAHLDEGADTSSLRTVLAVTALTIRVLERRWR